MASSLPTSCTAFAGSRLLASGSTLDVVLAVKDAVERDSDQPVLVFDDDTGRTVDFDLRGTRADVAVRHSAAPPAEPPAQPRGRGRPRLGVVGREVTLLPRHWEWLATQPGGTSVALRKLVDDARRTDGERERMRRAHERAYHFITAAAGDRPGFEEATRALFADDRPRFERMAASWPADIRTHALRLAFDGQSRDPAPATA